MPQLAVGPLFGDLIYFLMRIIMTTSTNRINFTKASIESLAIPASGWRYDCDTKVAGLTVGVGANGVKTYVL